MKNLAYQELRLTKEDLNNFPVIGSSHTDNLVIQMKNLRVWVSRMTTEDGAPYDNQVTLERLVDGVWIAVDEYNPAEVA